MGDAKKKKWKVRVVTTVWTYEDPQLAVAKAKRLMEELPMMVEFWKEA